MTADVSGIWEGTREFGTAPAYEVDPEPLEIKYLSNWHAWRDAKLTITSQDEYRKVGTGTGRFVSLVSTVSGQFTGSGYLDPTPVSGFVDDTGLVKLIFYEDSSLRDTIFIGRLTRRGLVRDISGNLMYRTGPGPGGGAWVSYQFGTLSVKKFGLDFSDRVYMVNSVHIF
jgi:hypothetical protein